MEYNFNLEETLSRGCVPPPGTGSETCTENDEISILNVILTGMAGILPAPEDFGNLVTRPIYRAFLRNLNDALSGTSDCGEPCEDSMILDVGVMDLLYNNFTAKSLTAVKWALRATNGIE